MVVLFAVLVVGGVAWLAWRKAGHETPAHADGGQAALPDQPFGGRSIPAQQLANGRIAVSGLSKEYRGIKAAAAPATPTWMSRYAGSAGSSRPARPTRAGPGVIICASSASPRVSPPRARTRSWNS
jgi:hypothetical protein